MKKYRWGILGMIVLALAMSVTAYGKTGTTDKVAQAYASNPIIFAGAPEVDLQTQTITLNLKKVRHANRYEIYMSRCTTPTQKHRLKKVAEITDLTELSYTTEKLETNVFYKFRVIAYEDDTILVESPVIHDFITSTYRCNSADITADSSMVLKPGNTGNVEAQVIKADESLPLLTHADPIRYISTNTSVAMVDTNGNVTAVGKGRATIYSYTVDGRWVKTKVTVRNKFMGIF